MDNCHTKKDTLFSWNMFVYFLSKLSFVSVSSLHMFAKCIVNYDYDKDCVFSLIVSFCLSDSFFIEPFVNVRLCVIHLEPLQKCQLSRVSTVMLSHIFRYSDLKAMDASTYCLACHLSIF